MRFWYLMMRKIICFKAHTTKLSVLHEEWGNSERLNEVFQGWMKFQESRIWGTCLSTAVQMPFLFIQTASIKNHHHYLCEHSLAHYGPGIVIPSPVPWTYNWISKLLESSFKRIVLLFQMHLPHIVPFLPNSVYWFQMQWIIYWLEQH